MWRLPRYRIIKRGGITPLLTFCIYFFLSGCGENENRVTFEIKESVSVSEIIDENWELVKLEIPDSIFLGQVSRLIFHQNYYYILDARYSKKIFVFSEKGHYVRSFGNVGKGPEEYIQPSDFYFRNDTLSVIDEANFKVLKFDLNGNHLVSHSIDIWIDQCLSLPDNELFVYSPTDYSSNFNESNNIIRVIDKDFNEIKGFLPYREVVDDGSFGRYICKFQEHITFLRPVTNEIYSYNFKNHNFKLVYNLDYTPYNWPVNFNRIEQDQNLLEKLFLEGGLMAFGNNILENAEKLSFQTFMLKENNTRNNFKDSDKYWNLIDKKSNTGIIYKQITNDISDFEFAFPSFSNGNKFISVIRNLQDSNKENISLFIFHLK